MITSPYGWNFGDIAIIEEWVCSLHPPLYGDRPGRAAVQGVRTGCNRTVKIDYWIQCPSRVKSPLWLLR